MKVALIDVDGKDFPSLPLMKISAYHKAKGDSVEWYEPLYSQNIDRVYMSKVFGFTQDYQYPINAKEIVRGGSGYCITVENGKEIYHKELDKELPSEIEHIYPDYSIYDIEDTAYGFLTRGCPRGCEFCVVGCKEGRKSYKVADLNEFWNGQKNIVLLDPNITACSECEDLFQQLIDSKAKIEFNQGLDIRMMTEKKAEMIKQMKTYIIHFAWDQYKDKDIIVPKLKMFADIFGNVRSIAEVYVLCNFNTTLEQDLDRIYTIRDLGYTPYVMLYNKNELPRGSIYYKLQRWVNNKFVFRTCDRFEDYTRKKNFNIEGQQTLF